MDPRPIAGALDATGLKFAIVVSRFNEFIGERLLRAAVGQGCPGRALRLDLDHYLAIRDSLLAILRTGVESRNFAELFAESQKLGRAREGLENLLEVLYSLLQDILHIETRADGEPLRNADRPKTLMEVAARWALRG